MSGDVVAARIDVPIDFEIHGFRSGSILLSSRDEVDRAAVYVYDLLPGPGR